MIIIEQSNNLPFYFIKGELPSNVLKVLDEELSYWIEGIEHSKKFKKGETDGYCHLLRKSKKGDWFFPLGLIDRVKEVFDAYEISYQIKEAEKGHSNSLNLTWNDSYKLRDYQQEAVLKAVEKGRGVIVQPTGSGKTLVVLAVVHAFDLPALILVHTKQLMYQWDEKIKEVLNYSPGLVGDGNVEFKDITVGMMQTATKTDLPDYDVFVGDEIHHISADSFYKVAMKCNAVYRFGVSATPWREDGAELKIWASTGEIISNITGPDLIERGYLAKPKFIFLDPPPATGGGNWQQMYKKGIVLNEGRNQQIIEMARKLANEGLTVYVHVERIKHGEILSERLNCPFLSGRDDKDTRERVLQEFEEGKIKLLVSTLLGEGYDCPSLNAIIIASGQKTAIGIIQKIGRALRVADDKDSAIVVDFADKGRYLSSHFEQRYHTMREYYGRYFNVEKQCSILQARQRV